MRLGLDLDNTILETVPLFHKLGRQQGWLPAFCPVNKAAIKAALSEGAGDALQGELRWQRLQALAYGEHIDGADLFPGFAAFMAMARSNRWAVFIVSHKSRHSHLDPSVDLHYWARTTLKRRGFFRSEQDGGFGFKETDISLCPSRDQKIATISNLRLDGFIDDLPAVLKHEHWPKHTRPILIHGSDEKLLSAADWTTAHAIYATAAAGLPFPRRAHLLKGGGNNRLTRLEMTDEVLVYKAFHNTVADGRDRLDAEWRFLEALGEKELPAPIPRTRTADGLFMSHVAGRRPDAADSRMVSRLSDFLIALDHLGRNLQVSRLPPAAHARFRPNKFIEDLAEREAALCTACLQRRAPVYREILAFLKGEFAIQHQRALAHFQTACRRENIDRDAPLAASLRFPSPSDFGPHNCLEQADGSLVFLDFEYAGWDDPAKLLCDILYHVGSGLSRQQRLAIVAALINHRDHDKQLRHRVAACGEVIRMEWMAIVLNIVRPEELARKCFAGADAGNLLQERLERARRLAREPSFNLIGETL